MIFFLRKKITRAPLGIHFVYVKEALVGQHLLVRIEPWMREQLSERRTAFLSGHKGNDVMYLLGRRAVGRHTERRHLGKAQAGCGICEIVVWKKYVFEEYGGQPKSRTTCSRCLG